MSMTKHLPRSRTGAGAPLAVSVLVLILALTPALPLLLGGAGQASAQETAAEAEAKAGGEAASTAGGDPPPAAAPHALPQPQPQPQPLRIGFPTRVSAGPLFLAEDMGLFDEAGLVVQPVKIEDPDLRFGALTSGRVDAVIGRLDRLPRQIDRQPSLRYLLLLSDSRGYDALIARKTVPDIASLKGRRLAVDLKGSGRFLAAVLLAQVDLSLDSLTLIDLPPASAGRGVFEAQAEAALTWEPWITRAQQSTHAHLLTTTRVHPLVIADMLIAPAALVEQRREALQALARAWTDALTFTHNNPEEAHAAMARGVAGWLSSPKVLAQTLQTVILADAAANHAAFGRPEAPGPLLDRVNAAFALWRGIGVGAGASSDSGSAPTTRAGADGVGAAIRYDLVQALPTPPKAPDEPTIEAPAEPPLEPPLEPPQAPLTADSETKPSDSRPEPEPAPAADSETETESGLETERRSAPAPDSAPDTDSEAEAEALPTPAIEPAAPLEGGGLEGEPILEPATTPPAIEAED